jgi:hypothetical protein
MSAPEYPSFPSRIREDTWKMLQEAAAASGRSVSQEFEHRLRRGLDDDKWNEETFGDRRTFGVMKTAAMAAVNSSLLSSKNSKVHWTSAVEGFDRALDAISKALKIFRPHELRAADLVIGSPEIGAPTLKVVREIQEANTARPLDKMTKRQRAMLRLKDELGDLLDRPLQGKKQKTKGNKRLEGVHPSAGSAPATSNFSFGTVFAAARRGHRRSRR